MAALMWIRRQAGPMGTFVASLVELGLAATGLWFTVFGSSDDSRVAEFLAAWGFAAIVYLFVAGRRVRKRAFAALDVPMPALPAWSTALAGRRFGFFLTVAASLTGLGAALDALWNPRGAFGGLVTGLSAFVMFCAWMLLHVGYARFYSRWTEWRFPRTEHPQMGDFLYFAVTVGVSFAASDVEVQSHRLRWHVMVHSVVSFFYNAIVLAVAVSIITRR